MKKSVVLLILFSTTVTYATSSQWFAVKTNHFAVVSNTDLERSKLIAYKLEQFRSVLLQICPKLIAGVPTPTVVKVFKDTESYYEALSGKYTLPAVISGFVERKSNTITINDMFNISDNVSYHEYIHVVTDGKRMPIWFEEGIAQFYENFDVLGSKARLGEISASRLQSLRIGPLLKLKRLLALNSYQEIARETSLDLYYAQSWALIHFLLLHERGSKKEALKEYLQLLDRGKHFEEAFRQAFGTNFEDMDEAFEAYLHRSSFYSLELPLQEIDTEVEIFSVGDLTLQFTNTQPNADLLDILPNISALEAEHSWRYLPALRPVTNLTYPPETVIKVKQALEKFKEGCRWMEQGKLQEALHSFEETIKLNPEFGPAYAHIGTILSSRGDYEAAQLAYEKARAVTPGYAGTYLNLAITQMETGKYDEAETAFKLALSLYPSSAVARLGLGQIHLQRREYAWAVIEFRKAIGLARSNSIEALNAYVGLAAAYFYMGEYTKARQQYAELIKIEPTNAVWYRAYADCERMLKNLVSAEHYYRKALSLDPKNRAALEGLDYLQRLAEYNKLMTKYK